MDLFKRILGEPPVAGETTETGQTRVEPVHLTTADFEERALKSELPAIVDFWAEWCGPCHRIAPAVRDLAVEYEGRAVVAKVNADENPEILEHYGIMGIPTLIYFKGGREVDRVVGVTGYATLKGKLERLLA